MKFSLIIVITFIVMIKSVDLNENYSTINEDDNNKEIADLKGQTKIFADYCLKSRDYIINDIKEKSNSLSPTIFTLLFKYNTQIDGDEQDKQQQSISNTKFQPSSLYETVSTIIDTTKFVFSTGVVSNFNKLKNNLNFEKFTGFFASICKQIANYDQQNKASFNEFVKPISWRDSRLAAIPFEDVACLTTRRITRLDSLCKLPADSKAPIQKIMKSMG